MDTSADAGDARDLSVAATAGTAFVRGLRLSPWFHVSLGAAVAVQIATAAVGIGRQSVGGLALAAAGCVALAVVAVALVRDFRRRNGVRLQALTSRVVLGTSDLATATYAAGLAAAVWGDLSGRGWLVPIAAVLGGAGYAAAGRRWWRHYQAAPSAPTLIESRVAQAGLFVVAAAGVVALVVGR